MDFNSDNSIEITVFKSNDYTLNRQPIFEYTISAADKPENIGTMHIKDIYKLAVKLSKKG